MTQIILHAVIITCLGVLIWVRTRSNYVGVLNIIENADGSKLYSFDLNGDPENIDQHKKIVMKVNTS